MGFGVFAKAFLVAFFYSEELLRHPEDPQVEETLPVEEAYLHRCALCGIRVRTLDGRTAVAAAHIVPWSVTHDDRPANGMALCRMCHWGFDEGLMRVSPEYEISTSPHLNVVDNLPGYLTNLEGRGIVGPSRKPFWPDAGSLRWHHNNVFRAG